MRVLDLALLTLALVGCKDDEREPPCPSGSACRWAGVGEAGYNSDAPNAHRLDSEFYYPEDVAFGPDDRGYIVDFNNHRIRRAEPDGSLVDVIGTDYEGDGPRQMEDRLPVCAPPGAPGTTVAMNHPTDLTFGPDGKLYVAVWHNHKLRIYDPATELVTAIGDRYGFAGEGSPACHALFDQPKAIEVDTDGTIYTIDQRNVRIRKIAPGPMGVITTIAGRGIPGDGGDGGPAVFAELGMDTATTPQPTGALVLSGRTLYLADTLNHRIRRIDLDTGLIDCIAGSTAGYSGDGGPALDAQFNAPTDMELGPDGRLYIADRNNHVIRALDLTTHTVETVVGSGVQCETTKQTCADRAPAREIELNEPWGVAFDNHGDMYISDTYNHRILRVAK